MFLNVMHSVKQFYCLQIDNFLFAFYFFVLSKNDMKTTRSTVMILLKVSLYTTSSNQSLQQTHKLVCPEAMLSVVII